MRATILFLLVCCLSTVLPEARAQATRTWVSGVGDDANPCSRTAPCKTFAGAISKTAAGGKINVLDPAGYGAVTITKAITIEAEGDVAGVLVSGTNGIVINAGTNDPVVLRNLKFEGIGTGLDGIRVLQVGSLLVDNCRIEDFSGNAISLEPPGATKVVVRDSVLRRNAGPIGEPLLLAAPPAGGSLHLTIERSTLFAGIDAIEIGGTTEFHIRDTVLTGGSGSGLIVPDQAGSRSGLLERVAITDFAGNGISVSGSGSSVRVTDSLVSNNAVGVSATNLGQVISFGDNRLSGNVANGSFSSVEPKQ